MTEFMMEQRRYYLEQGKKELDFATNFLHNNCENWSPIAEEIFCEHIELAKANLHKAMAIEESLKKMEAQND